MEGSMSIIPLGTYRGKYIIINTKEVKHGLIAGISSCNKEDLIKDIKEYLRNTDTQIYSIDLENDKIDKCLEVILKINLKVRKLKRSSSTNERIFLFVENATYLFNTNTPKEKYLAQKVEELLNLEAADVDIHIIISTYTRNNQYLPIRILDIFDFIILGFTQDIDESMYLLKNDMATRLIDDISNSFILKHGEKIERFSIKVR